MEHATLTEMAVFVNLKPFNSHAKQTKIDRIYISNWVFLLKTLAAALLYI
jgi:cbb3-type cytochrome oxidase subunit 1